jgi:hypothetical protein
LERLREEAKSFPMMFATGVPDFEIEAAENALGCKFAEAYVRFLREFGGAMVGPEPILGLRRADVMGVDAWSVVETTRRFRAHGWAGVDDWYVVSIDGAGNPIGVGLDGAVYISDHHGGGTQKVAGDFEEFLSSRL